MTSLNSLLSDRLLRNPHADRVIDVSDVRHLVVRSSMSLFANRLGQESKKLILNIVQLDGVPPGKDTGGLCVKYHLERG